MLSRKGVGIFDAEKAEHDRSIWRKTQEVIAKYTSDGFYGVVLYPVLLKRLYEVGINGMLEVDKNWV